jgi:hypothetical protein
MNDRAITGKACGITSGLMQLVSFLPYFHLEYGNSLVFFVTIMILSAVLAVIAGTLSSRVWLFLLMLPALYLLLYLTVVRFHLH